MEWASFPVTQALWREYFVCGSFNNPNFNKVENNPICIDIAWYDDEDKVKKWEMVRIIILC